MTKRAKLRVITKLQTREIIPTSIRFNFELSGSKEVTGNDDFFDLAASCSMAIQTCQQDLKNQMAQVAQMEVDVIDRKTRAIFHQALQGFSQLLLIENAPGPVTPTASEIRKLSLSTLDCNIDHFTKEHNFQLDAATLFADYKTATDDVNPAWTLGNARLNADYCTEHSNDFDQLTGLMFETIVHRWMLKCRAFNQKEKASLLESTQRSFFKVASTRDAAEAIALEKTMDETRMDDVIASKVAAQNKSLRAQISKLENSVRRVTINDEQKNSHGGASKPRAPKQKTNASTKAQTTGSSARKTKPGRKPAAAAAPASATLRNNASAVNKGKKKKNAGNTNKKKTTFKA
jgi:hypothetical protein